MTNRNHKRPKSTSSNQSEPQKDQKVPLVAKVNHKRPRVPLVIKMNHKRSNSTTRDQRVPKLLKWPTTKTIHTYVVRREQSNHSDQSVPKHQPKHQSEPNSTTTDHELTRRLVRSLDDISLVNPDILHLLRGRGGGSWWAGSEGTGDCLWGIMDPPE